MTKNILKTTLAGAFMMSFAQISTAQAQKFELIAKYDLAFLGLPVGRMKNSLSVTDTSYAIAGGMRTNSVVALVAGTKASFSSSGRISGRSVIPSTFKVNYKTRKKTGQVSIAYKNGNISGVSSTPKVIYKAGTIPVEKVHLKKVLDPLSALVLPVNASDIGNGSKICNRTLPVYDGKTRINLVFSYKSTTTAKAKGFRGKVINCAIRYQPVSGIRPFKKNIKFMKANRDIEISVARVGNTNVYALFGFRVKTDKGTASGRAYHFAKR